MPSYSKGEVVLVRYPFSDLSAAKVRPAVSIGAPHSYNDLFIVPLTSRVTGLRAGEFVLNDWRSAGLNVPSAVKRGIYTVHPNLLLQVLGQIAVTDSEQLDQSLRIWLALA